MRGEEPRQAAALMRERAEAALSAVGDAPWNWDTGWCDPHGSTYTVSGEHMVAEAMYEEVAEYLCPMHPAVALAVADWLDMSADVVDTEERDGCGPGSNTRAALAVARAYLGTTP